MRRKISPLFILSTFGLLIISCSSSQKSKDRVVEAATIEYTCTSSREYITALSFLRAHSEFKIPETKMRDIATRVAQGCSNAAHRFASTVNLLVKVKLDTASAIKVGLAMASTRDDVTEAFKQVFKTAYTKKGLDLNQMEAIAIAKRFSLNFKGNPEIASDDFVHLVKFCTHESELNLPRPTCAKFATELSALTEEFDESVSEPFTAAIEFIRDESDGPKLTTADALKLATDLVSISPHASKNFIEAYEFAVQKRGLGLTRKDAVHFASTIAGYSRLQKLPQGKDGE